MILTTIIWYFSWTGFVYQDLRERFKSMSYYGNQSQGYLIGDDHYDHLLCPGLQPGSPSQTPGGLVLKRGRGHVTAESGVVEVGVFRALQPYAQF